MMEDRGAQDEKCGGEGEENEVLTPDIDWEKRRWRILVYQESA